MSWEALGHDPVPGEVDAVLRVASTFGAVGDRAETIVHRLRVLDGDSGPQVWHGEAADAFRDLLAKIGPDLVRMVTSHHTAQDALRQYAGALGDAQAQARRAEALAENAVADRFVAARRRDQAAAEAASQATAARAAQARIIEAKALEAVAALAGDAAYLANLQRFEAQVVAQRDTARAREGQARRQEAVGAADVSAADARLAAAKALAHQAEQVRDGAARTAARSLDVAGQAGVEHRNVLERLVRSIDDGLRDLTASPEFASWMNIISDVGGILASAGTIATLLGAPHVGLGFIAIGAGFKGVSFLGTALAAHYGHATSGQVIGRGLDFGLTLLSGLMALKAAGSAGKITEYAGTVKRALWYDDARHATGAFREVAVAGKLSGVPLKATQLLRIDPSVAFAVKTGVDGALLGGQAWDAGTSLGTESVQLYKDIQHFHDPQPQHTFGEEAPRAVEALTGQAVDLAGGYLDHETAAEVVNQLAEPMVEHLAEEAYR